MSRHRFKLVKRMGNPLFERPGGLPIVIKKRLLQEHEDMERIPKKPRQKKIHNKLDKPEQAAPKAIKIKRKKEEDMGEVQCKETEDQEQE